MIEGHKEREYTAASLLSAPRTISSRLEVRRTNLYLSLLMILS